MLGRVGRTVQVRSILARSDHAWEVTWMERNTNETGATDPQSFTGVFTVTTRPPRTADEIAINPLGILISDFSWSRQR
jgi:type IV secretion system protein VirB5